MRTIERSTHFKKDYKRYFKSVYGSELDARLKEVIGHLLAEQPLPIRFRDHQLRANWKGYRDCHVFPELVLIYQPRAVRCFGLFVWDRTASCRFESWPRGIGDELGARAGHPQTPGLWTVGGAANVASGPVKAP